MMIEIKGKDELVKELHHGIDEASRKIDELKVQTHLATKDAESSLQESVAKLEAQRDEMKEKVAALKNSAEDASEELGKGCQQSWATLKESLADAFNKFRR